MENALKKTERSKIAVAPVGTLIWKLGLPMIVSMILQAVYNIVDTAFVINMGEGGVDGNLALTYAFPVQILMIAVGVGTGIGINALLSKSLGEGNARQTNLTAGNGIFLMLCIYAVFLLFGLFGAESFVAVQANGNETAIAMGTSYLKICCTLSLGCIGLAVYERFLQSTGKTTLSTLSQIAGALTNIALDYVFIFPCGMGIAGAAWATVIGQIVSLILAMTFHYTLNKEIDGNIKYIRPDKDIIKRIYQVGISAALMQALLSVMMLGMNLILGKSEYDPQTLQGSFGVYYKIMQFALFAFFGLSNTLITVLSFNYGMKERERVSRGITMGIIDALITAAVITVLFEILAVPLAKVFGMASEGGDELIEVVVRAIRISATGYVFMSFTVAVQGVLQAFRYSLLPLLLSFLRLVVFVFPSAWLFTLNADASNDVWWSLVICEVLTAAVSAGFLAFAYKKKVLPMPSDAGSLSLTDNLIVTVSREHGSNGKYIAKMAADKLGIRFYDKELAFEVAKKTGLAEEYIKKFTDDENSLRAVYLSLQTNREALIAQAEVIKRIAAEEDCVIVGRGADYILRNCKNCIRIYIRASKRFRMETIMRLYGDSKQQARANIRRSDKSRNLYYKFISGRKRGYPSDYDLVLDSSRGVEKTADAVVAFVKGKLTALHPNGLVPEADSAEK